MDTNVAWYVHDLRGLLHTVKAARASVVRLHLRDRSRIGHDPRDPPAKRADVPVMHQFAVKGMKQNQRHALARYSSRCGSTYVSSRSANFSMSVKRLTRKVCLASNGWPFSSLRA